MSWQDRLRKEIKMISPEGNNFTAKWRGNDRSKDKKLGVFEFPNFDGTKVQDLGITGYREPLTIFFDGPDNDLEAERFWKACDERGTWQITHPVKGIKYLHIVSVTEKIQPLENGNQTYFDTNWIEPARDSYRPTERQIAAEIEAAKQQAYASLAAQYEENLKLNKKSEIIANEKTIFDNLIDIKNRVMNIIQKSTELYNDFNQTIRSIQDSVENIIGQVETVVVQIQKIPDYIILARDTVRNKIDAVKDYINDTIDKINEILGVKSENKNEAVANETMTATMITAMGDSTVTNEYETRAEIIEVIEIVDSTFNDLVNSLDNIQDNFSDNNIDNQYFSMSQSYISLSYYLSLVYRYLIDVSLSLKIEKIITLKKDRSPIEITVTEYGTLGENEENLEFFISTNKLKGNNIRLIPAGTEVKIYV